MRMVLTAFSFLCVAAVFSAQAETSEPTVRVAAFQGDCAGAITYTFDDGLRDQKELALPMLEEVGFHATFFVIPARVALTPEAGAALKPGEWGGISWSELVEISGKGHEIGNHSWHHENLTKLDDARLEEEIEKGREEITAKIGKAPMIFCYPYNASDERVKKAALRNHLASRDFQSGMSGKTTIESFNTWADETARDKKWSVAMIHGIAAGFDAFSSPEVLREHFRYVKTQEKSIWVDTFANIWRYMKEREGVRLRVDRKPGEVLCVLETPLDPKIYDVPLTVVVEAKGVTSAEAIRAGKKLPVTIQADKICVDAIPGSDPIQVTWR